MRSYGQVDFTFPIHSRFFLSILIWLIHALSCHIIMSTPISDACLALVCVAQNLSLQEHVEPLLDSYAKVSQRKGEIQINYVAVLY